MKREDIYDLGYRAGLSDANKHGEWIKGDDGNYYCSECGMPHSLIEVRTHRFCWNCGVEIGRMEDASK